MDQRKPVCYSFQCGSQYAFDWFRDSESRGVHCCYGLPSAGQKTTARDLALLCRAYLKNHPEGRRFHSMTNFMHQGRVIRNTNSLLGRIAGVTGLKTGWTVASGYNLIVTATKGKANFLAIILGAPNKQDRDAMAIRLIDAAYKYPNSPSQVKKFMDTMK